MEAAARNTRTQELTEPCLKRALRIPVLVHQTVVRALAHDCLHLAQSAAYSAMFSLFPALIVAAAIIDALPESIPLRGNFSDFFERVLPSDVLPMLDGYFTNSHRSPHTNGALAIAAAVSLLGASGVMATLMEGIRRANDLPADCWTFLQRRGRALLLVPLSLIPLSIASILVVFGHWITFWLASRVSDEARTLFFVIAASLRWAVALAGVVGLSAIIYHLGTPMRQRWYRTLPGALVATAMWFVSTVVFGWYVTRYANYAVIYGSLGAGIALLIWLFITFLSVLSGAEFNRQLSLGKSLLAKL